MTKSISSANQRYLQLLNKYPLLTKAVTAAVLGALNERLASVFSGDFSVLNPNVPLMAFYGFAINAPFSHYAYMLLNRVFGSKLTTRKKILQILTSMATITPIISFIMVSFISLIGHASFVKLITLLFTGKCSELRQYLKSISSNIKADLKRSLFPVIRSSWISSPVFMAIAQKYLEPNQWVVFFAFCYFILGTYNNTKVKRASKSDNEKTV